MHELSFLNWKENRLFTPSTRPVGSDLSSIPSHSSHQCPQTMSALSISSKILMGCHPVHSVFPACILRTRTHLALCLLCCQGFVRRTFPNIYIAPKATVEKAMAPHSSTVAWRIPWMKEPGGLQSMRSLSRTWLSDFTYHFHALEKEMATHSSVLAWRIPGTGESGGLPSMGSHRVGQDWSDLAAGAAKATVLLFDPV